MSINAPHNPYQSPQQTSVSTNAVLLPRSLSPTPLFLWLIAIVVFEAVLSAISLSHAVRTFVPRPIVVSSCFGLNFLILCIVSWRIGRRFSILWGIFLSQLVHTNAWLVFFLMTATLQNVRRLPVAGVKFLLAVTATSALASVATSAIASIRYRIVETAEADNSPD